MVATIGYRQDLTLLGYGINVETIKMVATYQLDVQAGGGSVMVWVHSVGIQKVYSWNGCLSCQMWLITDLVAEYLAPLYVHHVS